MDSGASVARTDAMRALGTCVLSVAMTLSAACTEREPIDEDEDTADELPTCEELPRGPFTPMPLLQGLVGSEDLAFDSKGRMASRAEGAVMLVTAKATTKEFASSLSGSFGMRFREGGNLAVALPEEGQVIDLAPGGKVTVLASDLGLPNGVFPDSEGNVWVTEMTANRVIKIAPDESIEVIASDDGAVAPNGIVLDEARGALFYTQFGSGKVMRVDLEAEAPKPVLVTTLPNARPDGLTLDSCGNLYAVDNGNARLFRVFLDEAGAATEKPELLAKFPVSVANAQFGRGRGFARTSLYVIGVPGQLFEIPLSVEGANVVGP